jgi:hypothetical protein
MEKLMCCDIARKHTAKLPARLFVRYARRYEEIARRLLCMRAKPVSILQKERRREALRQMIELTNQTEQRRDELLQESVAASLSPIHFRASVERLASQRKQMGKYEFFRRLDAIIGRYVSARISGATWAAPLSLLQLLALERERDRDSLWSFLEDFFERWEEISAPRGTYSMKAIILELLADGQSMKEVVAALEKAGFRLSADGIKHYANVRAIASRLRRASQQFK